jgi:hypothetical protein
VQCSCASSKAGLLISSPQNPFEVNLTIVRVKIRHD